MHAPWSCALLLSNLLLFPAAGSKHDLTISSDVALSSVQSKSAVVTSVASGRIDQKGGLSTQQNELVRTRSTASTATSLMHADQTSTQKVAGVIPPATRQSFPVWVMWWQSISLFLIVKTLCMISNITFQMSPFPIVKKIRDEKDTGDTDSAPLVSIAYGCCQWTFYGTLAWYLTQKPGFLVIVYANCLGAVLGVFYVGSYHVHCRNPDSYANMMMYYKACATLVLFQAVGLLTLPSNHVLFLCGLISSCCSVVAAVSPLTVVPIVLRTRCSASVPLPLVMASTVSAVLWIICGVMLWDSWIAAPNLFATFVNFYLLHLAFKYPRDEQESLDKWSRWDVMKKVPPKIRLACPTRENAKDLDSVILAISGANDAMSEATPLCSTGESPDFGGTF